jgi:hypothetical protein
VRAVKLRNFAGVLKGAVNSQLDSTDRQFFKLRVDLAGFDDIANFESPLPEIRSLCWYYHVFDAFVEHEKSPNILKGKSGLYHNRYVYWYVSTAASEPAPAGQTCTGGPS